MERTDEPGDGLRQFLAQRDVPCPRCGYNLRGLSGSQCPECGRSLRLQVAEDESKRPPPNWLAIASHPVAIAAAFTIGVAIAAGRRGAAAAVLLWAGAMAMVWYWRWTRRFVKPDAPSGLLVTGGGVVLAVVLLAIVASVAGCSP